eukprot:gene12266-15412_t
MARIQNILNPVRGHLTLKEKAGGVMVTLHGPEIRTSVIRGGHVTLKEGQEVILVAAGSHMFEGFCDTKTNVILVAAESHMFEGFCDTETNVTKIGINYRELCSTVGPGDVIMLAEGVLKVEVVQILSGKELKAKGVLKVEVVQILSGKELQAKQQQSTVNSESLPPCPSLPPPNRSTVISKGSQSVGSRNSSTSLTTTAAAPAVISKGSQRVGSHKLVDIPDKLLQLPLLSERTAADIHFCANDGSVDFITLPFTQSAADVLTVRKALDDAGPYGPGLQVFAQIDSLQAIRNFDEILDVADGIIVSRGAFGHAQAWPEKGGGTSSGRRMWGCKLVWGLKKKVGGFNTGAGSGLVKLGVGR